MTRIAYHGPAFAKVCATSLQLRRDVGGGAEHNPVQTVAMALQFLRKIRRKSFPLLFQRSEGSQETNGLRQLKVAINSEGRPLGYDLGIELWVHGDEKGRTFWGSILCGRIFIQVHEGQPDRDIQIGPLRFPVGTKGFIFFIGLRDGHITIKDEIDFNIRGSAVHIFEFPHSQEYLKVLSRLCEILGWIQQVWGSWISPAIEGEGGTQVRWYPQRVQACDLQQWREFQKLARIFAGLREKLSPST